MIQLTAKVVAACAVLMLTGPGVAWASQAPATQPVESNDAEPSPPRAVVFDAAATGELDVVRAPSGHLLVHPTVNGQDVGWFIFDTGAGINCIDKGVAEKLSLPDGGSITATGMGGSARTRLRIVESLRLGPLTLQDCPVLELDLKAFQIFMGRPIAGIIGYEYFNAAVVEIDFATPRVNVHDPKAFALPAGASWADLTLLRRRPYVNGSIEGNEPGLFVLDIGSNTPLIVHSPAVTRFKLLEGRETRKTFSGGVGGMSASRSGSVTSFELAGQTVHNVGATFSESASGATASAESQGTIGVGVLAEFRLIVNYPQKKIALVRP